MSFHYGLQWCSRPECACGKPGRPCHEWMGYLKKWRGIYQGKFDRKDCETWPFRYCPCCGFEKSDHKSLIHNGKKPR